MINRHTFLLASILMAYQHSSGQLQEIGISEKSKSIGLSYILSFPENHNPNASYPTILFLHGGDRSNTKHHPSKYAKKEGIDFPFIVIAPHCTGGCSWSTVDFATLLKEVTTENESIDNKRIYLTGYSMGGYGSWSALTKFPHLFAAAAPIAEGGNTSEICKAKKVPTRAYHGDNDNVVNHSQSVKMIKALQKCGGNAQLITYEGVDHGSWPITFKDPEFYCYPIQSDCIFIFL